MNTIEARVRACIDGEPGSLEPLDGDALISLLSTPSAAARLLGPDAPAAFRERTIAALGEHVRKRLVQTDVVAIVIRAHMAWPDADWSPLRRALTGKREPGSRRIGANEEAPALFQLHILFWDELTRDDLVALYQQHGRPNDHAVIGRHPKADITFWRMLLRAHQAASGRVPTPVLEHAAQLACCRSDEGLLSIMLASGDVDVYVALVANTSEPELLSRTMSAYVERGSAALAWCILDRIPKELRPGLGDALMRLLNHPSREVRFKTQQMLLGARYADLPKEA